MSSMNTPDPVALRDPCEHRQPGDHASEHRVDAVQAGLSRMRNKELAAAGVGPGECDPDSPGLIGRGIHLVAQHEPGATPSVAAGIPVLNHEVRDGTMPAQSVKVAPVDKG